MNDTYAKWRTTAAARGVKIEAVPDCIGEPVTMADVERRYRTPTGKGIENHRYGLDIWSELRGWIGKAVLPAKEKAVAIPTQLLSP